MAIIMVIINCSLSVMHMTSGIALKKKLSAIFVTGVL